MKSSPLMLINGWKKSVPRKSRTTFSPEDSILFGEKLGKLLPTGSILSLSGELGAGKTTFMKGFVRGASGADLREVTSPTFTLLNIYEGSKSVYHFDLYRIKSHEEFSLLGFSEYFTAGGICCIEWAERIAPLLPQETIFVDFAHAGDQKREITIRGIEVWDR